MPKIKKKIVEKNRPDAAERGEGRKGKVFAKLRGMKDVMFDDYRYWDLVCKKAADLANYYGFKRIDTPILERQDLFEKALGKNSDLVVKEMYSFLDKSGDKVAMRPDVTPGIARAYIEHSIFNLEQPVKFFFTGPVFRHEKPQSGTIRQHTQFDLEIFDEEKPAADAQLILIAYNFFRELQIDIQVQINNIGCNECRQEYIKKLLNFYKERGKRSKLCVECKKRLAKNPMQLLDCKEKECVALRDGAPQIVDSLCDGCRNHFIKVLEYLDDMDLPYNLNPFMVRGLEYYNKTVFEFWPADNEDGRQISLGGGGRYDNLVEQLGGKPTFACGFGLGLERTIMKIKEKNIPLQGSGEKIIFIAQLGDSAKRKAMNLFEEMRRAGFQVRQSFTRDNLKAQLEDATKMGAAISLIIGQKEVLDGTILIRDMESGIQEVSDYNKTKSEVEKRLAEKQN